MTKNPTPPLVVPGDHIDTAHRALRMRHRTEFELKEMLHAHGASGDIAAQAIVLAVTEELENRKAQGGGHAKTAV